MGWKVGRRALVSAAALALLVALATGGRAGADPAPTGAGAKGVKGPPAEVGTVFTVNAADDADDGTCDAAHCSLREAIQASNSTPGPDTIGFALTGSTTIEPASMLPAVQDSVTVDGTSQAGYATTPVVELDGSLAGSAATGLQVMAGPTTIRALVVRGWDGIGVLVDGATDVTVVGSYIGTDAAGAVASPNGMGVLVRNAANATIGGAPDADRTVVSGNTGDGITLEGATGALIENDYVGVSATGLGLLGNGDDGIFFESDTTATVRDTRVTGNGDDGIDLDGALPGTVVRGNLVGPDAGQGTPGNGDNGIEGPRGSRHSAVIGGTVEGEGNRIEGNAGGGVVLDQDNTSGVSIRGNAISSNGGLGIDLWPAGVTPNDPRDPDPGPNGLQNFPVITSAVRDGSVVVEGTLDSVPNASFSVDLYGVDLCDASGNGEGDQFLGTTPQREFVTGTATDAAGDTSEFSACFEIVEDQADLSVTVTDSPDPVLQGNDVTYTVTVTNGGPDPAVGVTVTDQIPLSVTFRSATPSQGTCSEQDDTVTCSLGDLAAAGSATVSIVATTDAHGTITTTASVASSTEDPDELDNEDTEQTTVNPKPSGGVQTGEGPGRSPFPIWPLALAAVLLGLAGLAGLRLTRSR